MQNKLFVVICKNTINFIYLYAKKSKVKVTLSELVPRLPTSSSLIAFQFHSHVVSLSHGNVFSWRIYSTRHVALKGLLKDSAIKKYFLICCRTQNVCEKLHLPIKGYQHSNKQFSSTFPQRTLFCEWISVTFDLEHFEISILYLEIYNPYTVCYSLFPGECTHTNHAKNVGLFTFYLSPLIWSEAYGLPFLQPSQLFVIIHNFKL